MAARGCIYRTRARPRQHDVAGPEADAETLDLAGQPGHRGHRIAQHRIAAPLGDDLTAVSGIDDDVAALLRANGITTWERLGHAEVGDLRALLDLEGPRFHACQPGTWPIQGRLLAAGDWSSWRALVDGLRDGRPIWR